MLRRFQSIIVLPFTATVSLLAHAHGDLDVRIATLTAQLAQNPTNALLWLQSADLHRQHGETTAALAEINQANKLKPHWAATELQLARIRWDEKNFRATIAAATACLAIEPAAPDALVLRARSHAALGQLTNAVTDLDAVFATAAVPLPDLYLERARWQATLGKLDDALRGLDDGMKRLGHTPSLALPAIDFERQRGTFTAALERLDKARNFFDAKSFARLREEILAQAETK